MNRSEKALVGIGAFVSALVGLNGFADSSIWVQAMDYLIPAVACGITFFWGWAMGYRSACEDCVKEQADAQ